MTSDSARSGMAASGEMPDSSEPYEVAAKRRPCPARWPDHADGNGNGWCADCQRWVPVTKIGALQRHTR